MNATFIPLIALLLSCCDCLPRVLHIGVDGFLQKCWKSSKNHSIIDYMMLNGSYTFNARTAIQAVSAPGWSNILCGMESEKTGILGNDWIAPWISKTTPSIIPISGLNSSLPCIFEHLKSYNKDLITGALYDWFWFENITSHSINNSLDYDFFCPTYENIDIYVKCDEEIKNKVIEMIKSDKEFNYLFVYFGQVDEQGHTTGFCSPEYINKMEKVNNIITEIFDVLREKEIFDTTDILLTTDHGATYLSLDHGDQTYDNLTVPIFAMGPSFKKGFEIERNTVRNLDIPATISKIFNIDKNPMWTSSPIEEIFKSNETKAKQLRSDISNSSK